MKAPEHNHETVLPLLYTYVEYIYIYSGIQNGMRQLYLQRELKVGGSGGTKAPYKPVCLITSQEKGIE